MKNSPTKLSVLEKHGFSGIRRWPNKIKMARENAIEDFFLHGYAPEAPMISKKYKITAFGSCFAGNVSKYLHNKGYAVNAHSWKHANSDFIRIDEIMVHTPALLAQFEWAFLNKKIGNIFSDGSENKTYHDAENIKSMIVNSDVFIITFGLTEAWYDLKEDCYLWKFVPKKNLDPKRFVNKSVSFSENLENIKKIYEIIRSRNSTCKIIMTLSPIPLLGTYSGKSIICANSVSKSKLRAALDEFLTSHENDSSLYYFPSYELVNHYIPDAWEDDNRHIKESTISQIMEIFDRKFLLG